MTDADHAAVLRRWFLWLDESTITDHEWDAFKRAISVLDQLGEGLSCPICGHTVLE